MDFIYHVARDPRHFAVYGSDLLSCFNFISHTSADATLRRTARRMGVERARQWRRDRPRLPEDANADTILDFVQGTHAADCLGLPAPELKEQVRRAAARHTARDYLSFDPREEPPPEDVPAECACGTWNRRGRKRCAECGRRLEMLTRYAVWYDALMRTYTGERYGVTFGARFGDVLRWIDAMRPYPEENKGEDDFDFYDAVYAVTHVVYTLNDYSVYRLSPRWLPREFAFLKSAVKEAIATEDAEMMGELLDALRAFGLKETHPLISAGVKFLLSSQNEDGSWGDPRDPRIYARYHPTWTAVDGLRENSWQGGLGLSFPEVRALL
ncbi:MAG TPA: hypothetical protein VFX96_13365 [Pyrinomonadaceae bacterium]|nr:hypothetical protein [Pyrinomonadaceae bacterium]